MPAPRPHELTDEALATRVRVKLARGDLISLAEMKALLCAYDRATGRDLSNPFRRETRNSDTMQT